MSACRYASYHTSPWILSMEPTKLFSVLFFTRKKVLFHLKSRVWSWDLYSYSWNSRHNIPTTHHLFIRNSRWVSPSWSVLVTRCCTRKRSGNLRWRDHVTGDCLPPASYLIWSGVMFKAVTDSHTWTALLSYLSLQMHAYCLGTALQIRPETTCFSILTKITKKRIAFDILFPCFNVKKEHRFLE